MPAWWLAAMRAAAWSRLAEHESEFLDGEVAAEGPVVDAALQQHLDHCPDLLFHGPGGIERADDGGVLAPAAATTRASRAIPSGTGTVSQAGLGQAGGGLLHAGGGQGLQQPSRGWGSTRYSVARATPAASAISAMLGGSPPRASRSAATSRIASATRCWMTVLFAMAHEFTSQTRYDTV